MSAMQPDEDPVLPRAALLEDNNAEEEKDDADMKAEPAAEGGVQIGTSSFKGSKENLLSHMSFKGGIPPRDRAATTAVANRRKSPSRLQRISKQLKLSGKCSS